MLFNIHLTRYFYHQNRFETSNENVHNHTQRQRIYFRNRKWNILLTTIWYIASTMLYISSLVMKPSLSTSYSRKAPRRHIISIKRNTTRKLSPTLCTHVQKHTAVLLKQKFVNNSTSENLISLELLLNYVSH